MLNASVDDLPHILKAVMARNMLIALEAYNSKTILLIDSKLEI